jgi:cytoskeleton protein RodZ
MEETPATPVVAAPVSIGERLRAGRERAGLSVAATAEKLHLDVKVIEALEADRFAELGASVYVRGHLRRYADFVGEAGAELVSTYTANEARPPPPDLTQVPHPERRADPRRLVAPLVGLGCAAVLLLAIWWVLSGSRTTLGMVPPVTAPVIQSDEPQETMPATPLPADASSAATTPAVQAASAPASATPSTAPANDAEADIPAAPPRATRLRLELSNDSWIEVYDSRGERLFYDVAVGGSVQDVSGRGPLRVVLGNAAAVGVQVDGQARQIPSSAFEGESARFVVNRSGSLSRAR